MYIFMNAYTCAMYTLIWQQVYIYVHLYTHIIMGILVFTARHIRREIVLLNVFFPCYRYTILRTLM